MNGRRVLAITRRLLQQFRRDRRTLALLFVAPLVILALLGYLLRGGGSSPAVGVVNEDSGPVGGAVATQLLKSSKVSASQMDRPTADDGLRAGTLAGYVLFPADFSLRARQGVIAPEIHLEGTQPGPAAAVVGAVTGALQGALASSGTRVAPKVFYLHGGPNLDSLDYLGAVLIGLIVFFLVFIVTSVSFLRERTQGTLERLMATPLRRGEIVIGYMLGFGLVALVQSVLVLLFTLYVLHIHNQGGVGLIFVLVALLAVGAVNLGIFLSVFARTEFQAVQFIPLVIAPQVLLSGIFFPVTSEPVPLQYLSNVLPLTYAVYGLREVMLKGSDLSTTALQVDLLVGLAFAALVIALAAATLRRRVA